MSGRGTFHELEDAYFRHPMALVWKQTQVELPADGLEVWIRLDYWWGTPVLATWRDSSDDWRLTLTGQIYPVWTVSRWAEQ